MSACKISEVHRMESTQLHFSIPYIQGYGKMNDYLAALLLSAASGVLCLICVILLYKVERVQRNIILQCESTVVPTTSEAV